VRCATLARCSRRVVIGIMSIFVTVIGAAFASSPFRPIGSVVSRPAAEYVPRTARLLTISWSPAARHSIRVTDPRKVAQIARVLNSLPAEGPGQCSQGFIEGPPTMTFSFRTSRTGPTLAKASQAAHQDFGVAWCVPTTFAVRGRRQIRLEGGSYLLNRAQQILGRSLSAPTKPPTR
jgi:hypothetical protein